MEQVIVAARLLILGLAIIGVAALTFVLAKTGMAAVTPGRNVIVDYVNVVIILLTTVTVFFTAAALGLAVLGVWGFRNIKVAAANSAQASVRDTLSSAFESEGVAYEAIREEITNPKAPLGRWIGNEIERKVTEKLAIAPASLAVDEDDPTDEGNLE